MNKQTPNDSTWHRIEELRHQRHAEIRAAHSHGDGTIDQEEAQLEHIRARRKIAALKAQNDDLRRQLDEVTK